MPHFEETNIQLDDLKSIDGHGVIITIQSSSSLDCLPIMPCYVGGGTGKSSLIHALLNRFSEQGLRVLQVSKHDLLDLPKLRMSLVAYRLNSSCCVMIYRSKCPMLYKAVKSALDGSVVKRGNVLIYATRIEGICCLRRWLTTRTLEW